MLSLFIKKLLFTRQLFWSDGKLEILSQRFCSIPSRLLYDMQKHDPEKLFELIKAAAEEQIKNFSKRLGISIDGMIEDLPEFFNLFGIGKLEMYDIDKQKKHAIVKVHDTPFISYYHDEKPICSITCGVLSGIFSFLFSEEVKASVNKCAAKGQPYCEFIIK